MKFIQFVKNAKMMRGYKNKSLFKKVKFWIEIPGMYSKRKEREMRYKKLHEMDV